MEDIKDKTEDLISHTGDYLETFFKISLLKVTRKTTDVASTAISLMVICIVGMMVLFFGGIALGWWLGNMVNSRIGGFAIVAGIYLVIAVFIIGYRKKIVFPYIRNILIRKMYERTN